ncbi:UNVERIFIED_CONTAM: hypothetical protein HDU68_007384 [Siphonaria sp. JEL0065]|nr:hypothetical protein HDU68_007384 [Siphonaria sp. JEL0065]
MAAPAGLAKMNKLDIQTICATLDFINIMAYDFHGAWDTTTNHQAGLYDDTPASQRPAGFVETSIDTAVNYWINNGCPANKIVVGVPFYGHAWNAPATNNGLFQPETNANIPTFDNGEYGTVVADGTFQFFWDAAAQASYAYSTSKGIFISLDTPQAISVKVGYGAQKGLGGFMVWPLTGDDSKGSLLSALTGPGTPPPPPPSTTTGVPPTSTTTTTTVAVASSTVAQSSTTTTTTVAQTSTTTTTTVPVVTTTASGSNCYPAWVSTQNYPGGSTVSYNNVNYKNSWWENPGSAPGAANGDGGWVSQGACGGQQSSTTTTTTVAVKSSSTTTTTTVPVKSSTTTTTTVPVKSSTTTTTTVPVVTTTAGSGGPVVGESCSTGTSQCFAGTMYFCQGVKWIVWYTGC